MIRAAVLERELVRTARRRNTYLLRFLFAAGLLALLATFWSDQVEYAIQYDRGRLAGIGRELFEGYTYLQLTALAILTPILVAQSVIEERDERTIELLAITHLSPEGILWGKLLSRLLGMASLVLAGTPVLALCLSLGGVAPLDVVNVLLQTSVLVLSAGAMATFLGLFASGPIVPAALTWIWLLCLWGPGSLPLAAVLSGDTGFAFYNPIYAIEEAEGWYVLASLGSILPIVVGIVRTGAAAFGSMASGADDADGGYGALSTSVWRMEAIKRNAAGLGVLLFATSIGVPVIDWILNQLTTVDLPGEILGWFWNVGFVWVGTVMFMFGCRWSLLRRRRPPRKKVSWRRMAKEFQDDEDYERRRRYAQDEGPERAEEAEAWGSLLDSATVAPVSGPDPDAVVSPLLRGRRNLSGREADVEEAARRRPRKRWFLREIRGNPVFWRETVTRAHGGLTGVLFRGYFLLIFGLMGMFALGLFDGSEGPEILLFFAAWAGLGSVLATILITSSSLATERRAGTLELICSTKLGPRGVVFGKLQAIAAFSGPALIIAIILALPGMNTFVDQFGSGTRETTAMLWKWGATGLWGAVAIGFLALSCMSIGLRAKTPGRIWILNVLWGALLTIGPVILLAVGGRGDGIEMLVGILVPIYHEPYYETPGPTLALGLSIVWWAALSVVVFRDNVRRVAATA